LTPDGRCLARHPPRFDLTISFDRDLVLIAT
jgi:hypothetical protein